MRNVLIVGGNRDGDRVQVLDDRRNVIVLPGRYTMKEFFGCADAPYQSRVDTYAYQIERFQAGRATMWVAYPMGTDPESGLAMLLAGYVGNQVQ